MTEQTLTCPHCGKSIALSDAVAKQIEEQLALQLTAKVETVETRLRAEYEEAKAKAVEKELKKKAEESALEMEDLRTQISEAEEKLRAARKQELDLLAAKRKLEDDKAELELEITRRLDEERAQIEEKLAERLEEEHRLKDLEKDKALQDLRNEIQVLKRKAEQGSQQTQGEVAELELESLLKCAFPFDEIEPVGKGVRGADVIQHVYHPTLGCSGRIVWESKNAKNWSDGWIDKLKEDLRSREGDHGVIVSVALPTGVRHFQHVDGVWVTELSCAVALARALRDAIVQAATLKVASDGKNEKMEALYEYLSGAGFRGRVEAVVEAFVAMRDDLEKEKRATEKQWAKRDKQIERVVRNMSGMYGDVHGIVTSLPELKILELPGASVLEAEDEPG